jgi:hypothetical protein
MKKVFVQKKKCNIKKRASFDGNPAVSKRPVAFRPRFTTGLALIHNVRIIT